MKRDGDVPHEVSGELTAGRRPRPVASRWRPSSQSFNENTARRLTIVGGKVLREGVIVDWQDTRLAAREREATAIEDSAPIKAGGRNLWRRIVFHDVTERRRASRCAAGGRPTQG